MIVRSALIAGLLSVLVPGTALADAAYAPVDQPGPPYSVSQDKLAASLKCTPSVTNATREPVLLESATGVTSDQNYSWNYERAFRLLGIPYCTTNQPGQDASNLGDIQVRGEYIAYAMRQMRQMAGRRIAVMGHSQGGMVMRWALRFWPDTRADVEDVVGMAGSNHGTILAHADGKDAPANLQQAADSKFIKALNSGQETFAGVDYTEIYSHFDEVVTPNSDSHGSSSVHGPGRITNVALQEICPADTNEHLQIGTVDAVAYALFMDALTHDGPADPARIDRGVCSQPYQPGIDPATGPASAALAAVALETNENTYPQITGEPPLACYVTASCAGLPRCTAPRAMSVDLDALVGRRLRRATARIAGHRVRVMRRHGHLMARLDLRKLAGRTLSLRASATTRTGKRVTRSEPLVVCFAS
jgi:hypothetical protein